MVEPIGICEKHQLPLDRNGDCELCRLDEMPSKAPPAPSAWWAVIIPVVILLAGVAWAFASFGAQPAGVPHRGVRTSAPRQAVPPQPAKEKPPAPEPREIPEPPRTPSPGDDIPSPEPSLEEQKIR